MQSAMELFLKERDRKRRYRRSSCIAAALAVTVTTYSLILPASALTNAKELDLRLEDRGSRGRNRGSRTATGSNADKKEKDKVTSGSGTSDKEMTATASNATPSNATPSNATPGNATSSNATRLTYEDDEVSVTATIPEDVELPDDARLSVLPIRKEDEGYEELMSGAEDVVSQGMGKVLFYDINIVDGAGEILEIDDMEIEIMFKKQKKSREGAVTVLQYDESQAPRVLKERLDEDEALENDGNPLVKLYLDLKNLF